VCEILTLYDNEDTTKEALIITFKELNIKAIKAGIKSLSGMGNALLRRYFSPRESRVLFLGLDATGKTTALYSLKLGQIVTTIPTIGFNVETLQHNGVNIAAWDVGMRDKMRPLMRHYFPSTSGIVFFFDCVDIERFVRRQRMAVLFYFTTL